MSWKMFLTTELEPYTEMEYYLGSSSRLPLKWMFLGLVSQVRDKMNLRVNAISTPEKSFSEQQPSRHIESLR